MIPRCSFALLAVGSALGLLAVPDSGAAQVPGAPSVQAARLEALHARLREQAAVLQNRINATQPPGTAPGGRPSPLPAGYHPVVRVLGPGSLDWTFVTSPWSLDPTPAAGTAGYIAARQIYELYVPPRHNPRQPYGMILHIPTERRSDGWAHWQYTCERQGLILAGVHNAGNDVHDAARARTVLDVLDDVRRRFPIDPDRTYIVGGSGAGHAASQIAFALPELFGGVIGICGAWNLRVDPVPRLRVRERLSVALVTGATDFNRPELEREFYPILREEGVRSRLWVVPGMGHGCPTPAALEQVFLWVDAGLAQRRAVGALFPASRLIGALSPEAWSTAMLLEAGQRLALPDGPNAGVYLLHAVAERWNGLPAAEAARKMTAEFDAVSPVASKDIYRSERLRFRRLQARTFDGIVNAPPPPGYPVPRINLLRIAVGLWQEVHDLADANSPLQEEANVRLAALRREGGS